MFGVEHVVLGTGVLLLFSAACGKAQGGHGVFSEETRGCFGWVTLISRRNSEFPWRWSNPRTETQRTCRLSILGEGQISTGSDPE